MAIVSTGIQVDFQTGFCGELVEVSGPNLSRVDVDVSHHLSPGWREYLPGELVEGGVVNCTIAYDPTTAPPIDQPAESIVFTHPDSGATKWQFQGYMNAFALVGTLDVNYVANIGLKVAGAVDFAYVPN